MLRTKLAFGASAFAVLAAGATDARAGGVPRAGSIVRVLGSHAESAFAPASRQIGALVALPVGARAEDYGLESVVPGIGRLRGPAAKIGAFSDAHPDLHVEIAPPLHPLLDRAGSWVHSNIVPFERGVDGTGVLVGVADTGLDVSHQDLLDENGKSRVAWILDLSMPPAGLHPDLEDKFGVKDASGKLTSGAVLTGADIDALLAAHKAVPGDEIGHGTHVSSIAVGNGGWSPHTLYKGVAPNAKLVFVRVTRSGSDGIENDDLVRGIQFIFDRADAEKKPLVANISLGSDFGPHDGTFLWEKTLASFVGPDKPGHAIVVAAGNSGSIAETPIHQSVHVSPSSTVRVPIATDGASNGSVQVWVSMRPGTSLSVGLDGPDGQWIAPVPDGKDAGKNGNGYTAGVANGSTSPQGAGTIPSDSHGAVVVWSGAWPKGQYSVVLEGEGTTDLYLQGIGDAGPTTQRPATFLSGVREGTINLPATHPALLAVGCTVNRPKWISIDHAEVSLHEPMLDSVGGMPLNAPPRTLNDGEVCWFSSAGPTVMGVAKPEISAPGGLVIAAMAKQAAPGGASSIFTNARCPPAAQGDGGTATTGESDPKCLQVDERHAVAVGTSMSAPLVAGAVALLFQRDPTLTQDKVTALIQAGAHAFRGAAPFEDQAGPGELDVTGALDALDQMNDPALMLPSAATSWMTLSTDYAPADGSSDVTVILELRTADGAHRADMLGDRLRPVAKIGGQALDAPPITRRAPGLYTFTVRPPPGFGGSALTLGATFDGEDIVTPKTVPIASDIWASEYAPSAKGGCATVPSGRAGGGALAIAGIALALAGARRRRGR